MPTKEDLEGDDGSSGPSLPGKAQRKTRGSRTQLWSGEDPDLDFTVSPDNVDESQLTKYPTPLEILVIGTKGSGKTTKPMGIPCPNDGRFVILTWDKATLPGLVNWYGKEWVRENVEVANLRQPQPDKGYLGYDTANRAEAIPQMMDKMFGLLHKLAQEGDVDNLMLDDFWFVQKKLCRDFMYLQNDLDLYNESPEFGEWYSRTISFEDIYEQARKVPNHALITTGFAQQETWTGSFLGGGGDLRKELKDDGWWEGLQEPVDVILLHDVVEDENGQQFMAKVNTTKNSDLFPLGETFNLTDTDYSLLWEYLDAAGDTDGDTDE